MAPQAPTAPVFAGAPGGGVQIFPGAPRAGQILPRRRRRPARAPRRGRRKVLPYRFPLPGRRPAARPVHARPLNPVETPTPAHTDPAAPERRTPPERPSHFIRDLIEEDLRTGRHARIVTRFPPEPNGYLHIGHAKAICLNFGLAEQYGGRCHLRFDDTNPETEDEEYVASIQEAVRWLGFDWGAHLYYASDYFEQFFAYGVKLIEKGLAYVDSLSEEEIRRHRGTVLEPGRPSPYRDRAVAENLDLFRRMRAGEFPDGAHVLRAKGDLASPNMKMRDPLLYRIKHASHYHTGDAWCIYPFYDYAHPLEDAIEGVTHSLCTLEFDNNREVYDWVLDHCLEPHELPTRARQYEFSRLNLYYTVMSKRKLLQLVGEGRTAGWDDPRMPTLFGMRRRGIPPEAIRAFCESLGVTKTVGRVDPELFEHSIRDDLNHRAPRVMAVLRPLRVVLTNYPEGQTEWLEAPYWPHDVPNEGSRKVPFGRVLYIEQTDFMERPPRKYHRLSPGAEVRLRYGYFIRCTEVVRDPATGEVVELRCTYDPATRGGDAPDGRRPRGTIHWVAAEQALRAEVRLYDRLFTVPDPDERAEDFKSFLNPASLVVLPDARIEPSVADDAPETRYQFERQGYFWRDPHEARPEALVFNRIVGLRDSWARAAQPAESAPEESPAAPAEDAASLAAEAGLQEKLQRAENLGGEARARFTRFTDELGLHLEEALVLAENPLLASMLEQALAHTGNARALATWIVHELPRERRQSETLPFDGSGLAELTALVDEGAITLRVAKDVFARMLTSGESPGRIVEERGLRQMSDRAGLEPLVARVVAAHPDKARQYREGKTGLRGFFMGQIMKQTEGRANPELLGRLLDEHLETPAAP